MENYQAIGKVELIGGDNARLKVIAYKEKGDFVQGVYEIEEHFAPSGGVFCPKFSWNYNFGEGEIISFKAKANEYDVSDGYDSMLLDKSQHPKSIGYRVYRSDTDLLKTGTHIVEEERIQEFSDVRTGSFYISFENKIYGVFKIDKKGKVVPRKGKEIKLWENIPESDIYGDGNARILWKNPKVHTLK